MQQDVLAAFFARESGFFLTGGAALAGYHLGHRTTKDLDLFTTEDRLDDGVASLTAAVGEIGASLESLRTSPGFRRYLVRRGSSSVVVDLVLDLAPQLVRDKPTVGAIRLDPPEEILANKLGALLSRAEIRDLIDVRALERAGYSVEEHLGAAQRKDAGLTPGQLAWVLAEIEIGDDAVVPGGVTATELRDYLKDLTGRLASSAFPG